MRSALVARICCLAVLAGAVGAAAAHVTIDVAGDYLLAHDAYDDVAHHSRALALLLFAAIATLVLAKYVAALMRRRRTLLRPLRAVLGNGRAFVSVSILAAIALLAAMEGFDCAIAGIPVDGLDDLLGGSIVLGLSCAVICGGLAGGIVYRLIVVLDRYEPLIAEFVFGIFCSAAVGDAPQCRRSDRVPNLVLRALMLSQRASKRGPPLSAPC
jgi:hypothetical protein